MTSDQKLFNSITEIEMKNVKNNPNSILGSGGFSQVRLVYNKRDPSKTYAMKKMYKKDKTEIYYIKKELELHKKLIHKNIIKFFDYLESPTHFYFFLEYAKNGDLFDFIRNKRPSNIKLLKFFYQTVLAINHIHSLNIMHRDLKPENILIDEEENVKICDFGWSAEYSEKDPKMTLCGTFEYICPEIYKGEKQTKKTDVWALGILLYELFEGKAPFRGISKEFVMEEIEKFDLVFREDLDQRIKKLILRILVVDPVKRVSTEEILEDEAFDYLEEFGVLKKGERWRKVTNQKLNFEKVLKIEKLNINLENNQGLKNHNKDKFNYKTKALNNPNHEEKDYKKLNGIKKTALKINKIKKNNSSEYYHYNHEAINIEEKRITFEEKKTNFQKKTTEIIKNKKNEEISQVNIMENYSKKTEEMNDSKFLDGFSKKKIEDFSLSNNLDNTNELIKESFKKITTNKKEEILESQIFQKKNNEKNFFEKVIHEKKLKTKKDIFEANKEKILNLFSYPKNEKKEKTVAKSEIKINPDLEKNNLNNIFRRKSLDKNFFGSEREIQTKKRKSSLNFGRNISPIKRKTKNLKKKNFKSLKNKKNVKLINNLKKKKKSKKNKIFGVEKEKIKLFKKKKNSEVSKFLNISRKNSDSIKFSDVKKNFKKKIKNSFEKTKNKKTFDDFLFMTKFPKNNFEEISKKNSKNNFYENDSSYLNKSKKNSKTSLNQKNVLRNYEKKISDENLFINNFEKNNENLLIKKFQKNNQNLLLKNYKKKKSDEKFEKNHHINLMMNNNSLSNFKNSKLNFKKKKKQKISKEKIQKKNSKISDDIYKKKNLKVSFENLNKRNPKILNEELKKKMLIEKFENNEENNFVNFDEFLFNKNKPPLKKKMGIKKKLKNDLKKIQNDLKKIKNQKIIKVEKSKKTNLAEKAKNRLSSYKQISSKLKNKLKKTNRKTWDSKNSIINNLKKNENVFEKTNFEKFEKKINFEENSDLNVYNRYSKKNDLQKNSKKKDYSKKISLKKNSLSNKKKQIFSIKNKFSEKKKKFLFTEKSSLSKKMVKNNPTFSSQNLSSLYKISKNKIRTEESPKKRENFKNDYNFGKRIDVKEIDKNIEMSKMKIMKYAKEYNKERESKKIDSDRIEKKKKYKTKKKIEKFELSLRKFGSVKRKGKKTRISLMKKETYNEDSFKNFSVNKKRSGSSGIRITLNDLSSFEVTKKKLYDEDYDSFRKINV